MTTSASPRGREAIRLAVLNAAAGLFATQGPEATSTRQIAAAAGVNRGLLHRHFGSKDQLVAAVVADGAQRFARELEGSAADDLSSLVDASFAAGDSARETVQVLVRAILDGVDIDTEVIRTGLVERAATQMQQGAGGDSDTDPLLAAALLVASLLGWQLFAPVLLDALDLPADRERAEREMSHMARELARRSAP